MPRKEGSDNESTKIKAKFLKRVWEVCWENDLDPVVEMIGMIRDPKVNNKIKADILIWLGDRHEGPQREGKPLVANTPEDSVDAAASVLRELTELSKPIGQRIANQ
jgi:hypothetical protein